MPGEGENSFRQNRRLFLRGPPGIELTEAQGSSVSIYKSFRKLPTSLCGRPGSASRPCISRRVLTAGIFPFPGQHKRPLPPGSIFSQLLSSRRKACPVEYGRLLHRVKVGEMYPCCLPDMMPGSWEMNRSWWLTFKGYGIIRKGSKRIAEEF